MWRLFNLDADLRRLLNLDFLLFSDVINNVSASLSCPNCINGPYRKCWNPRKLNCGYQTFYLYDPKKNFNQHHHTYFSGKSYRSYMSQRCLWSVDVNGASTIDVFAFSLWKWELFCLFLSNVSETCRVVLHVYELVGRTFLDRDHICEIFGSFLVWVHIHTTGKTASACSERNSRLNW